MQQNKEDQLKKIVDEVYNLQHPPVRDFTDHDFNSFIVVGFLPGAPIKLMIGKLVQVRMESGAFGSNQIFLRLYDGSLQVHENQWFYHVPISFHFMEQLCEIFEESAQDDEPGKTYSIRNEYQETGFIIPSKVKAGETTPMREVKKDFMNSLFKN